MPWPPVASATAAAKSGARVAIADVETELLQLRELGRRARRADDAGAERLRGLQRSDADTRRHPRHEQPFGGLQPALQDQHVVHDEEGQRHRGRRFHRQAGRDRDRLARIHHGVFGERAGATPHHALPDLQTGDAGAERGDLAGAFDAGGLGRRRP